MELVLVGSLFSVVFVTIIVVLLVREPNGTAKSTKSTKEECDD